MAEISRRSFLQGAGILGAGAALAGLVGCSSGTDKTSTSANSGETDSLWAIGELAEPSETVSADVCVVGAGGTGTAAAIEAAELGMSVIVVDPGKRYGGSFVNTEGMSGVKTSYTAQFDYDPDVETVVADCMNYHHWVPNHQLYMNFYNESGETIDWCEAHGAKFSVAAKTPTSTSYVHIFDHSEDQEGDLPGQVFMDHLGEAADAAGVQSYFETWGRKLIMEDGKVAGLLAERNDKSVLQIDAPVVIIATGGYSTNEPLLRELSEIVQNEKIFSLGAEPRNGDGFKMALDAGGSFAPFPGTVQWCGPVVEGCGWTSDGYAAAVQPTLWVNENAERFCPEDLWIDNFAAAGIAQARQQRTYTIISEADLTYFEENGPYVDVFTWKTVGTPIPEARKQFDALPDVLKVESLAEAAEAFGLDAEKLETTLREYNASCDAGVDALFGKKPENLRRMDPPYYVAQISCGYYCTDGGLFISPDFEVKTEAGEVIPGLYAGGKDAGGLFGDSYDVLICPGTGAGFAINSGRLAAKHAKEYLGK